MCRCLEVGRHEALRKTGSKISSTGTCRRFTAISAGKATFFCEKSKSMFKSLSQTRHELPSVHVMRIPSLFNTDSIVEQCESDDIHAHDYYLHQ